MRTIKETLTYNLVLLRKGRSMAAVAEAAGLPYRTYQDIEGGGNWPRVESLEAIANALGVPVTRLFQDPSLKPSPEEALAIVASALQSRRESPTPVSDNPDLSRVAAALEHPGIKELIMESVKAYEASQRKKASKAGSESA